MSKRINKPCGCAYIHMPGPVAPCWWQVIACPDHELAAEPLKEAP